MKVPGVTATALALVLNAALAVSALPAYGEVLRADADIEGCKDGSIAGRVTFFEQITEEGIKEVAIQINATGLPPGKHAVHIHETGICKPCSAANGHHDPGPFGHTAPDTGSETVPADDINHPFHMGDLVNIDVSNGVGYMKHVTSRITLSPGQLSILDHDGSALIIHDYPDTYCDREDEMNKGCAGGPRIACGVIRPVKD